MKFVFFLSLFSLASAAFNSFIVGGNDAALGQFPYMVSLRSVNSPNSHGCGGGIINQRWILSAAHCFILMPQTSIIAVVGSNRLNGGVHYGSVRIVRHPRFIPNIVPIYTSNWNDIALIKTDRPITLTALIQPIPLGRRRIIRETPAIIAGFGAYDPSIDVNSDLSNLVMSENLQFINTQIITHSECFRRTSFYNTINPNYLIQPIIHPGSHICTLQPRGIGVCFGDSGSLLAANGEAVGIVVSSVRLCAQARGAPDIYTRISNFIEWIDLYIHDLS